MSLRSLVACLGVALLAGPAVVWAAKPPGAGGGDRTAPAAIGSIAVKTSALALTLRFLATGDDGTSGNAAAYDVFYRSGASCSDADNPGVNPDSNPAWMRASRSLEIVPEPPSVLDFFDIRPLLAGQDYCVAIRVRDEVPNWSGWRVVHGATGPDWSLANSWPASQTNPTAITDHVNLALVNDAPVAAWMADGRTAVFAGDGWQTAVPLVVPSTSFTQLPLRLAGNPGAGPSVPTASAAVTVTYTTGNGAKNIKLINQILLVDAGPAPFTSGVSTIATGARETGGLDEKLWGGSSITYVQRDGVWNPVVTIERIEAKSTRGKRTHLTVTERVGQAWLETSVLTREGPDQRYGFYDEAVVFTKPNGALGLVGPHCGITVYAERSATDVWTYWDAGRALMRYRAAFDSIGNAVVLGQDSYLGVQTVVLRSEDFFALDAKPAASCAAVAPQAASQGEVVNVVPEDGDMPYRKTSGIAIVRDAAGVATFITATANQGNYKTVEQRLIYRCADTDPWRMQSVDRTNSVDAKTQPVMNAAGDLLHAYSWGRFRRTGGGQWSSIPPDYMYVASRVGNPCGVVPGP